MKKIIAFFYRLVFTIVIMAISVVLNLVAYPICVAKEWLDGMWYHNFLAASIGEFKLSVKLIIDNVNHAWNDPEFRRTLRY